MYFTLITISFQKKDETIYPISAFVFVPSLEYNISQSADFVIDELTKRNTDKRKRTTEAGEQPLLNQAKAADWKFHTETMAAMISTVDQKRTQCISAKIRGEEMTDTR